MASFAGGATSAEKNFNNRNNDGPSTPGGCGGDKNWQRTRGGRGRQKLVLGTSSGAAAVQPGAGGSKRDNDLDTPASSAGSGPLGGPPSASVFQKQTVFGQGNIAAAAATCSGGTTTTSGNITASTAGSCTSLAGAPGVVTTPASIGTSSFHYNNQQLYNLGVGATGTTTTTTDGINTPSRIMNRGAAGAGQGGDKAGGNGGGNRRRGREQQGANAGGEQQQRGGNNNGRKTTERGAGTNNNDLRAGERNNAQQNQENYQTLQKEQSHTTTTSTTKHTTNNDENTSVLLDDKDKNDNRRRRRGGGRGGGGDGKRNRGGGGRNEKKDTDGNNTSTNNQNSSSKNGNKKSQSAPRKSLAANSSASADGAHNCSEPEVEFNEDDFPELGVVATLLRESNGHQSGLKNINSSNVTARMLRAGSFNSGTSSSNSNYLPIPQTPIITTPSGPTLSAQLFGNVKTSDSLNKSGSSSTTANTTGAASANNATIASAAFAASSSLSSNTSSAANVAATLSSSGTTSNNFLPFDAQQLSGNNSTAKSPATLISGSTPTGGETNTSAAIIEEPNVVSTSTSALIPGVDDQMTICNVTATSSNATIPDGGALGNTTLLYHSSSPTTCQTSPTEHQMLIGGQQHQQKNFNGNEQAEHGEQVAFLEDDGNTTMVHQDHAAAQMMLIENQSPPPGLVKIELPPAPPAVMQPLVVEDRVAHDINRSVMLEKGDAGGDDSGTHNTGDFMDPKMRTLMEENNFSGYIDEEEESYDACVGVAVGAEENKIAGMNSCTNAEYTLQVEEGGQNATSTQRGLYGINPMIPALPHPMQQLQFNQPPGTCAAMHHNFNMANIEETSARSDSTPMRTCVEQSDELDSLNKLTAPEREFSSCYTSGAGGFAPAAHNQHLLNPPPRFGTPGYNNPNVVNNNTNTSCPLSQQQQACSPMQQPVLTLPQVSPVGAVVPDLNVHASALPPQQRKFSNVSKTPPIGPPPPAPPCLTQHPPPPRVSIVAAGTSNVGAVVNLNQQGSCSAAGGPGPVPPNNSTCGQQQNQGNNINTNNSNLLDCGLNSTSQGMLWTTDPATAQPPVLPPPGLGLEVEFPTKMGLPGNASMGNMMAEQQHADQNWTSATGGLLPNSNANPSNPPPNYNQQQVSATTTYGGQAFNQIEQQPHVDTMSSSSCNPPYYPLPPENNLNTMQLSSCHDDLHENEKSLKIDKEVLEAAKIHDENLTSSEDKHLDMLNTFTYTRDQMLHLRSFCDLGENDDSTRYKLLTTVDGPPMPGFGCRKKEKQERKLLAEQEQLAASAAAVRKQVEKMDYTLLSGPPTIGQHGPPLPCTTTASTLQLPYHSDSQQRQRYYSHGAGSAFLDQPPTLPQHQQHLRGGANMSGHNQGQQYNSREREHSNHRMDQYHRDQRAHAHQPYNEQQYNVPGDHHRHQQYNNPSDQHRGHSNPPNYNQHIPPPHQSGHVPVPAPPQHHQSQHHVAQSVYNAAYNGQQQYYVNKTHTGPGTAPAPGCGYNNQQPLHGGPPGAAQSHHAPHGGLPGNPPRFQQMNAHNMHNQPQGNSPVGRAEHHTMQMAAHGNHQHLGGHMTPAAGRGGERDRERGGHHYRGDQQQQHIHRGEQRGFEHHHTQQQQGTGSYGYQVGNNPGVVSGQQHQSSAHTPYSGSARNIKLPKPVQPPMLPRKQELDLPAPPPPPLQHGEQPSASSNNRIGAGQQVAASSYQVGAPVPAGGVSAHQQQHVTSTGRGPHGQQHPTHQMNRAQQVGVSPAKPLDDTAETKDGFTPRSEYGEDDYSDNYDNLSDGVPMGGDYTNTPLHHELMHDGRGALAGNLQNLNSGSKRLFNSKADGSCQEHVPFEGLVSKSREQSSTPGPHSGSSSASADCSSSGGKNVKQATFLDAQAQLPGEPQNINPDHAIGSSGTNSSMAAAGPPMLISGISRANAQIGQSSTANKAAPATANAGGLALGAAGAGVFDQQAPPFNVDMTNLAPPPAMNNMIPGASGMNQTGLPVPLSVSKSWGRHGATSPPPGVCPPPEPPRGMLPPGIVGGPSLLVSSSQQQGNNFPAAGAGSGGFIAAAGKHGSCTTPMNNYSDTKLPSPLHNPHNSGKGQQPLHPKQPYAESQYAGDAGAKGSPASTVGRNTTNKQRVNKRAAFAAEQQHKLPINSSQQQPPQHQQLPDVYSIPVPMPSSRQLLQPPGEASTAAMQPPNTTASATVVVDHQEPGLFPFASQQAPTLPSAAAGSCKNKPTSNNPATAAPSYHQSAPVGHQPLKPEGQLTMEVGQHLQPGSVQVLSRNQSTSYSPAENSSTKMTTSAVGAPQGGPAPPAVIAQQPPLPASMGTAATTSAAAAAAALTKQDNFQIPQNPPPPPPVVPAVPQAAIMQQDYGKSNVVNNEQGILDDFCADNTFNPANSSNIAPQFGSQLLEDSEIEPVGDQVVDHMLTEHNDGCATSTMNNILDHHNVINTNSEQENREKCMSKTSVISHLTGSSSNKNSATSMTSNGNGSDGKNGTTGGNNNTASGSAGGSGNYNQSNPTTTPAGQNITPQNPHPQYSNVFNIYADNVEEAFRELAERDYDNFIGVESFFPGLVLRPTIPVDSFLEHHYATLRSNVDCTNLIQLDLTIRRKSKDPESDAPTYKTFRFHFTYNLHNELYSVDAMRKLVEAGSFQNPTMQSKRACIDSKRFAELFMTSGLVLDEEIIWIPIYGLMIPFDAKIETLPDYRDRVAKDINPAQIFRGLYDLAHLLQVLNGRAPLPEKVDEFYKELDTFFPKRCIASFHDFTSLFFSRSNEESITTLEKFASDQQSYLQNLNKYDGKPPTLASTKFLRSSDATGFFAFPPGFSGTAGSLLGGLHGAASSGNNSSSGLLQTASSVGNILLNGASTNGTTSRRESTGTTSAPSGQHPAPGSRRAEGSATVNNSTVVNGISDTAATGENHDNTGDGNKSVMTTSDRDRGQSIATSN